MRRMALLSILTALCYVGRMMFQFIPNVQPVTAVLIILTLTLGMTDGFIVAILSIVLTNFLLGMGPWTIAQVASFGVLIFVTGLVMKPFYNINQKKRRRILFALFAFFGGLLYGFVISVISVKLMGINSFWAYYIAGIPFDRCTAWGNASFDPILEPIWCSYCWRKRKKHRN